LKEKQEKKRRKKGKTTSKVSCTTWQNLQHTPVPFSFSFSFFGQHVFNEENFITPFGRNNVTCDFYADRFPILRSTILRVIPDSQLT
jgi:hypothetical protein